MVRRFSVGAQDETNIFVRVVEEAAYTPIAWRDLQFSKSRRQVLEPLSDSCETAQVNAFCSAYLERRTGSEAGVAHE